MFETAFGSYSGINERALRDVAERERTPALNWEDDYSYDPIATCDDLFFAYDGLDDDFGYIGDECG